MISHANALVHMGDMSGAMDLLQEQVERQRAEEERKKDEDRISSNSGSTDMVVEEEYYEEEDEDDDDNDDDEEYDDDYDDEDDDDKFLQREAKHRERGRSNKALDTHDARRTKLILKAMTREFDLTEKKKRAEEKKKDMETKMKARLNNVTEESKDINAFSEQIKVLKGIQANVALAADSLRKMEFRYRSNRDINLLNDQLTNKQIRCLINKLSVRVTDQETDTQTQADRHT